MSIFNSHGPCRGITLFKRKNKRVELWVIPANYSITPHSHPQEDVELMYLFGDAAFYRQDTNGCPEEFKPKWFRDVFRKFSVKHFHVHWFSVSKWPLVFINFQTFRNGAIPVSAAIDFKDVF